MFITLYTYFFWRFLWAILAVFGVVFAIIFFADFVEALRRANEAENFSFLQIGWLSILHVPILAEEALPFAVLFGSMIGFFGLSRSLELIVARAAGVSVWQFITPALSVCLLLGIFAICAYNPLAAAAKERYEVLAGEIFESNANTIGGRAGEVWLRQEGIDGQVILYARSINPVTSDLIGVTAFLFESNGAFQERVQARSAILRNGYWQLNEAQGLNVQGVPQTYSSYLISTNLTQQQIKQGFGDADLLSFWQLPSFIEASKRAGLETQNFELRYQTLLAKPLFMLAMALLAASSSIGLFRYGGMGKMMIKGILVGFLLFIASQLAGDLAQSGLMSPVIAAWAPPAVAILYSITRLLNMEDG